MKELQLQEAQKHVWSQRGELGLGKDRLNSPKGQNITRGWMWEVRTPKTYCNSLSQCKCKDKTAEVQWNISLPPRRPPNGVAITTLKESPAAPGTASLSLQGCSKEAFQTWSPRARMKGSQIENKSAPDVELIRPHLLQEQRQGCSSPRGLGALPADTSGLLPCCSSVHLVNIPVRHLSWETTPTASKNTPCSLPDPGYNPGQAAAHHRRQPRQVFAGQNPVAVPNIGELQRCQTRLEKCINVKLQAARLVDGAGVG